MPVVHGEDAHRSGKSARRAQLGQVLGHEQIVADSIGAQHLRKHRGDLVEAAKRLGGAGDGLTHLAHGVAYLAYVGLGQRVDGLGGLLHDGLRLGERGRDRLERLHVNGTVRKKRREAHALQALGCGHEGVLHEVVSLLHHAACHANVIAKHRDV